MKSNYSISIPKACHEDWSKMTPNEKGRFCQSCAKTVVDFTKMNVDEIQNYIHHNKDKRICGYIKQSQLNAINLKIPDSVILKSWTFYKLFLLALLLAMGTTLLNCSDNQEKKQKINTIEIVETRQKSIDTILDHEKIEEIHTDSITQKDINFSKNKNYQQHHIVSPITIETVGEIAVAPSFCPKPEDEVVFGILIVEYPPQFKDTPKGLSLSEKREYLSKRIRDIVNDNFNSDIAEIHGIKGKQRIITQFKIDEGGFLKDIKVRGTHNALETEAIRVLKLLPQFIPAKQRDKNVATIYSLPIVFVAED